VAEVIFLVTEDLIKSKQKAKKPTAAAKKGPKDNKVSASLARNNDE
jgi:hypothetical protein